jgi:hypothetical protein
VLLEETNQWDVPLMVTRGYSSVSFLHSAAEAIEEKGKPAYLYYFGDHDPSGRDITRATEDGLREFAPGAEIHFERVAVTGTLVVFSGLRGSPHRQRANVPSLGTLTPRNAHFREPDFGCER